MIERLALDAVQLNSRRGSQTGALMNGSENLIARARGGDQEAFRLLFNRFSRPVFQFIYQLVFQRDVSEDLTQETFVRAYQNLKHLRDDSRFSTWLFGIGHNVAREFLRSQQRRESENTLGDSVEVRDAEILSPADQFFEKELNSAIEKALAGLDEEKRVVFVLKIFQQRSYREIAEITGFSVPKIKTELHRARVKMRQRLRCYVEMK
ncbi:MAG TPA: sigma-70 family RNA polymerase sigma factor [Pyrinomonadaceae bacterium]|nr:sigma-70 family RNA polymerase sigma factor [Pyrinomonadaceae bacterium]